MMYMTYVILAFLACGAILAAIVWFRGRRRDTDPFESKIRQATKLKWKKTAEITKDGEGASWARRSVRFVRGKEEAVLWHKDATVILVRDHAPPTFDDFIELERWIESNPRDPDADTVTGEILYLRKIERFVTRAGYFEPLLEARATDKGFFALESLLHKVGYAASEDAEVLAALTLDALIRYQKDRNTGLRWLSGFEKDIRAGLTPEARIRYQKDMVATFRFLSGSEKDIGL